MELLVILVVMGIFVVPGVLYILSLRNALERCSPASRTMPPDKAWLLLIPIFNAVWHFFVVSHVAQSLSNEFRSRNVPIVDPEPGKSVGIAMCTLYICGVIPLLGPLFWFAGFICWIIYWLKVSEYSRALGMLPMGYAAPGYPERQTPYLLIAIGCLLGMFLLPVIGAVIWLGVNGRH